MKTTGKGKKDGILVRFDEAEDTQLRQLAEAGVSMSELIRSCVRRSLPDVVADLRTKFQR